MEPSLDITVEAALTKLMVLAALGAFARRAPGGVQTWDMAGEQTPADLISLRPFPIPPSCKSAFGRVRIWRDTLHAHSERVVPL